ncbi:hypothetical protein [Sulfobacillus sp. hq2]|uniref:hypothetical protein n=1 Tax=Sulfobacillus TaxID=28033 RepID=UPI000CD296A1|nr:hypothetical protein [Sulfobacillus sp. hq2]POB10125.1 hypothetical protein CO251_11615 [Sulfobacillus sp. hq2]
MIKVRQLSGRLISSLVLLLAGCGVSHPSSSPRLSARYSAGFPIRVPWAEIVYDGRTLTAPLVSATWKDSQHNFSKLAPAKRYAWPLRITQSHNARITVIWHPTMEPDMVMVSFWAQSAISHTGIPDKKPKIVCEVNATYPHQSDCTLTPSKFQLRIPPYLHQPLYVTISALWVPDHMPQNPTALVQHQAKWALVLMPHA